MKTISLFFVLLFSLTACGKPITYKENLSKRLREAHVREIESYATARRYLFGELHYDNGVVTDVYCHQNYDAQYGVGPGRIPDPKFLNCEHTWPQSKFKGHPEQSTIKSDLHHLYPASSYANSYRSNYPFAEVRGERVCADSYIGQFHNTVSFEPADIHKGNVARSMFYISTRYNLSIDPVQESFLRQWHVQDPVDKFEKIRNKRIQEIQGNSNPFIEDPSLVNSIDDF